MLNVGCVVYTKRIETGELSAEWHYMDGSSCRSGTGKAEGRPGSDFEGNYQIAYFNRQGEQTSAFTLEISRNKSGSYDLIWIRDSMIEYRGIGMLENGKLIAGWQRT